MQRAAPLLLLNSVSGWRTPPNPASPSSQVVAGTNWDVVFRVDDACEPAPGANAQQTQPSVVLEGSVVQPLPAVNAPMEVNNVQRLG